MSTRPAVQLVLFSLLFSITAASAGLAKTPKPNIVLMMADDMGMGDTSAYHDVTKNDPVEQLHTPNMERLARLGVRFTDAHTPSTRCTATRYGLLTGRYAWRSRLKFWVLFGSQGDPLIEPDRPTIASLLRDNGYRTAMVGKWHVGLRYRRSDGSAAAGWGDADLTQPLFDGPLEHGFDACWFTSRSHGTSGPSKGKRKNGPNQDVGPGHIHGRKIVGATGNGKRLVDDGENAYVLEKLGGRHSNRAIRFMSEHIDSAEHSQRPFFVYYAANSNHAPYTPDKSIGGQPVAGAARNLLRSPLDKRADYIYENDVALGRMLDWLESHDDPRRPGKKLLDNTIVIFTSDNGAEKNDNVATGPYRSNKGSAYEGGHRVPFLVAWPAGGVGDVNGKPNTTNAAPLVLTDLYATFAAVVGAEPPNYRQGEKGGEDSFNVLPLWRGRPIANRPIFVNDHKQFKQDNAILTLRLDNPKVAGEIVNGNWKVFFDPRLLRQGQAHPFELYDLAVDPEETRNHIDNPAMQPLVERLVEVAGRHRRGGGHQLAALKSSPSVLIDWRADADHSGFDGDVVSAKSGKKNEPGQLVIAHENTTMTIRSRPQRPFHLNARGLGVTGGLFGQVDEGEAIEVVFDRDVIVESVGVVAGNGRCGGFYQIDDGVKRAVYCVDADNDSREQHGQLSDVGVLLKGQTLCLSSAPLFEAELRGRWRIESLTYRVFTEE